MEVLGRDNIDYHKVENKDKHKWWHFSLRTRVQKGWDSWGNWTTWTSKVCNCGYTELTIKRGKNCYNERADLSKLKVNNE